MQSKRELSGSRWFGESSTREMMISMTKALEEASRYQESLDETINTTLEELAYFASIHEFQNALFALNRLISHLKYFPDELAFCDFLKKKTNYSVINTPQVAYFFALMNEVIKNQNKLIAAGAQEDKNIDNEILPFCVLNHAKQGLKVLTPFLAPHTVNFERQGNFETDVAQLNHLFSTLRAYKDCWINDRYFYRTASNLPQWDSLYIESFQDIFNDIQDKQYIEYILNNIQSRLKTCKERSFPAFIHYNTDNVEDLFLKISHYLGKDNLIQKKIEEQIATGARMRSFNQECQRNGAKTLLLGGTYGNGCVLASAQKYGKTIFTKTNGYFQSADTHCRWINYQKKPYIHEHSIIDPQITEGFNPFNPAQNVEKIGFSEFPALLQVSHRYKSRFLTSEIKKACTLSELPRAEQRKLIFAECVDYSKFATVKPSALSRIRRRNAQQDHQSFDRPILSWMHNGSRPSVSFKNHRQTQGDDKPNAKRDIKP